MDAVLVTPRCADPLYRRSVKISMGAVFSVPWTRLGSWPADISLLREAGLAVLALTPMPRRCRSAICAERCGPLPPSSSARKDQAAAALAEVGTRVRSPCLRVDSLNVGAAARCRVLLP
jgi:tRNA G18 (ribose-2'-O)-methylase SpoU